MTVGELRDELEDWPESFEIIFGCEELEFYRFKKRGADTVQLEFNQTVYKDAKTGKWHVDEQTCTSPTRLLRLPRQPLTI
jgi:hypothetical protein